ncbi:MAG: DNA-processing protein DprA [Actinomycetaceae bacterium]|nr:DNA-processing protein DprA [Actinomycetaceae bacterium]
MTVSMDVCRAFATWSALCEPGDEAAGILVQSLGPVEALRVVSEWEPGSRVPNGFDSRGERRPWMLSFERWKLRLMDLDLDYHLRTLDNVRGILVVPGDPRWPEVLNDLGNARPHALWVRGDPHALVRCVQGRSVSLVGARAATRYGADVAGELAYELNQQGVWVVSGGAYGIDAAAHRGAMSSVGLSVAIMAGGVDSFYPATNTGLLEQLTNKGAVIAEVPCGWRPAKQRFLLRNRLIAALTQATVVVEAGARSGAVSTVNHARGLGRHVAAVPGPVTSSASVGCHQLLREGAVCVTSAAEIIELVSPIGVAGAPIPSGAQSLFSNRSPECSRVLDAMPKNGWTTPEKIARIAGVTVAEARSNLGILELEGLIESKSGKYTWKHLGM